MRRIVKGEPPRALTDWLRDTPDEYRVYGSGGLQGVAREESLRGLIVEQGGLCAYCMGAIDVERSPARIEHYVHQKDPVRGKLLEVTWSNWLGVCHPAKGLPQQCDGKKGAKALLLRPSPGLVPATGVESLTSSELARYDAENLISYGQDGRIFIHPQKASQAGFCDKDTQSLQGELDEILNLNHLDLKRAREKVLMQAISAVNQAHGAGLAAGLSSADAIRSVLGEYVNRNSAGRYKPYCMIAIVFLREKLASIERSTARTSD